MEATTERERAQAASAAEPQSDAAALPLEVLEQRLTSWASHIAAAQAQWLGWLAEYDQRQGWAEWDCLSAAHWLTWKCGMTPGAARERVRVANALSRHPLIADAARDGRLSYSKLRALTRVVNPFNEADLAAIAIEASGAQLERICRGYRASAPRDDEAADAFWRRSWDHRCHYDGTTTFSLRVPDDIVPLVKQAVDATVDQMIDEAMGEAGATPDAEQRTRREVIAERGGIAALRADASVALLTGTAELTTVPVADVTMVVAAEHHPCGAQQASAETTAGSEPTDPDVPAETRADPTNTDVPAETHANSTNTDVPAETRANPANTMADGLGFDPFAVHLDGRIMARPVGERLCCDPRITPLLEDAAGKPIGVGRSTRIINRRIRRALERRDGNMCQFPGCHATRALHAHHIIHWAHGGATELDNLILVCSFHHHLVHEGGWRIDLTTRRFVPPNGATPVDPHPAAARLRGDASVIERTLGPDWPPYGVGPLEPPNFGPFDLPWTTAILHHNEQIRRLGAQRY